MKAVIKRLVCSVLFVLVLISSVPVAALEIDFDSIDWGVIGDMFGIPEDELEDLKDLVENLDEESLDKIVSEALGGSTGDSDDSEESDDPDSPGSGVVVPVLKNYVAVIGGGGLKAFYENLSDAIEGASKSEVVFVIDERGFDKDVATACQIIFNKDVDVSKLGVAKDYAVIEGSYVFGSTSYKLFMISKVSDALFSAVSDIDGINSGYSASLVGSDDNYTLTLTVNVSDIEDLVSGVGATADELAAAIMPAFPLFDNMIIGENKRVVYDGTYFYMDAMDALISDLLAKQTKGGIYRMAFESGNTLYTFPMSMQYQADKAVEIDVVVKVNATDSQMSTIKEGMRKTYARLYIDDLGGGAYTVNANAIGLFRAIAEEAGLLTAYDIVTEDGLRAVLDDVKVEWICKAIMAYDGAMYADAANALQKVVARFMKTEEYASCKDNYLGDFYAGNGVYEFSFDGTYDYSGMIKRIANKTASFGYDYAKLAEMCKGDTDITRSVDFVITAYSTTRLESANDVIEGVLDALDTLSGDTALVIDRQYTDGIISGLNFVLQPGSAEELLDVVTKSAALDVLKSIVPVCLVFDEAAINGKTVFDRDGSIAWKDTVLDLYDDYSFTFTYIANLQTKTVVTFDLHLENGEVSLDIPVSITLGISDENFAKLKKVAAKLADIIEVDGDISATDNGFSAVIDVTVDLRDDLDFILGLVALEGVGDTYAAMRKHLHDMSLQSVIESVTLDKLQLAAEKAGVGDQFNKLVVKLADRFGLDTTEPCNYKDLIAVLDANRYYQTYIKERLEAKLDQYDIESLLATKIGDFYRNDGTYTVSLGENFDGVVFGDYADRAINALLAEFDGEYAEKLEKAVVMLGFDSVEDLINKIKNRYATYYYAQYDLDINATLLLFHVYTVTFVDEDGAVLDEQQIVAGDNAERLPEYHGGPFYYVLEGILANVTEDRTIVIRKHYDANGALLDVDWIEEQTTDATCTEDGKIETVCTVCGEVFETVVITTPGHTWGEWKETTSATCIAEGEETRECDVCGEIETRPIETVDHTWGDWVETTPATCIAEGEETRECDVCGETETRPTEIVDHTWGEWKEDLARPATCIEQGVEIRECDVCGEIEERESDYGPHDYVLVEEIESSCTKDGIKVYHCSVCCDIMIESEDALGHKLEVIETVEPTCQSDGKITYKCSECEETVTIILPGYGHVGVDYRVLVQATCETPGSVQKYCTECGTDIGDPTEISALGHNYGTPVYVWTNINARNNTGVTCTATATCMNDESVCSGARVITETVPGILDESKSQDATCEDNGYDHYVATFTNDLFREQTKNYTTYATGHNQSGSAQWVVIYDATCTESGVQHLICKDCAEGVILEIGTIPAYGHDWSEWEETTPADCTNDGEKARTCGNCGEVETQVISAFGHDWSEWIVTTPADCTNNGEETRTCANGCGEEQTREILANGHTESDEWIIVKPATCTSTGEKHLLCKVCDVVLKIDVIPAIPHSTGDWTTIKDATCSDDGERVKICSECGNVIESEKIPATGIHTAGDWEISKDVTCTEDGEKVKKCTSGGEILETEKIPATGHKYVTTETEGVDCHTPYTKEIICSVCGDVKEKSVNNLYYPPMNKGAKDVAFLSGILVVKIEEMTVETFKSNFYCDVTVYGVDGNKLSDSDYVGTNCTFVCGECGETFTIAVIGDINGDGEVNAFDYMMIKRHVLGTYKLTGAALAAADVNVDLSADTIDYLMVKMYVLDNYDFYENVPDWEEVTKLIIDKE